MLLLLLLVAVVVLVVSSPRSILFAPSRNVSSVTPRSMLEARGALPTGREEEELGDRIRCVEFENKLPRGLELGPAGIGSGERAPQSSRLLLIRLPVPCRACWLGGQGEGTDLYEMPKGELLLDLPPDQTRAGGRRHCRRRGCQIDRLPGPESNFLELVTPRDTELEPLDVGGVLYELSPHLEEEEVPMLTAAGRGPWGHGEPLSGGPHLATEHSR